MSLNASGFGDARTIENKCRSLAEDIRTDIMDLAGEVGLANER